MSKQRFTAEILKAKGFNVSENGAFQKHDSSVKTEQKQKARGKFSNVKKNDKGMNKTESTYSLHLEARKLAGEIHDYWFEKMTLKIADDTRLTVDFLIQMRDGSLQLHDTKGHRKIYTDDAKVKMKVAANMFPFEFFVVFPRKESQGAGWDVEAVKTDHM